MINELNQAINAYYKKWDQLVRARHNQAFFTALTPTAVGWKTKDQADFDHRFAELRDHCDQIHFGWVNERWLTTLHLRDEALNSGLTTIKLMQRRPGSSDPTGLDHLDFLLGEADAKAVLGSEPDLKWTEEKNGTHCKWISVWFENTEAKLRRDTVYDVCVAELQETSQAVRGTQQ